MKKAEGEVAPKPVPRFGAKNPAPASPPALRRVKPASSSPITTPIGSPVSTPTATTEERRFIPFKQVQEEDNATPTTPTSINGTTPTPTPTPTPTTTVNNDDTPKENPIKTVTQKKEETPESQKIKNLESEISRLTTSREHQLQEIARLHSDLEKAQGIMSSHELANDKLNQQISSLQSQVGNLESDNRRILQEFEDFKKSTLERLKPADNMSESQRVATSQPSNTTGDNITHANHFDSTQPRTSTPPTNNLDTNSPLSTPTKQSPSFNNQTGKNENIDTLRSQNQTPPPMTSSLLYTDSPSPSKLNNHNPNYSFGKYSSYSNSRKSPLPPALQSKNTLQDLQDMIKTAQEQKSNVEILLQNIDVTLSSSSPSSLNSSSERPMTPEETVYFRGEKKNLERELSRLEGVISELKGQKTRCDSKLERAKQKIEENEAKLAASTSSLSSPSSSVSPSLYPSPPPSYLEVRDLSPVHSSHSSHSFDPSIAMGKISISPTNKSPLSSTASYSPTRNISPYFYYGNNDKVDLPPPTDRFNSSLHKLTSDHIQRFTPQFVPDAQKLKSFSTIIDLHRNSTLPHAIEKAPSAPAVSKDEPLRPSFEWNYYFASRS